MDSKEFINGVVNTRATGLTMPPEDLMHAAMGLCTEAGEFMDALKKAACHGRPIDVVNLREEIGDILWYAGLASHHLGTTFEELMALNQAKLKLRYPERFDAMKSIHRDVAAERVVLEGKGDGDV